MKKIIETKEKIKNEMNFGPMINPRFGSTPNRRKILVNYPMDSIKVGDIFVAKREDPRGFFDIGDKIEIVDIRPVDIGRGNEFKVKINGKLERDWLMGELKLVIGDDVKENKMRKEKDNIIEIKEEVKIGNVILEKGDKIEVLREGYLNGKVEFSDPFILTNKYGDPAIGVTVSNQTYYLNKDTAIRWATAIIAKSREI